MKNQKQEYRLPEDDEYEEDEYDNQNEEMDDHDEEEEEDQVAETVPPHHNRQSNFQDQNNYSYKQTNDSQNGYQNVQMNPNFQYPGGQQMAMGMPASMNQNIQGRLRPQSAKTQDDQQMKFQQQVFQNQVQQPGWIGGVAPLQQQQQNYMTDPSFAYQVQANGMAGGYAAPYVQGGFYQGIPQGGNIQPNGMKKRPTTAQRRGTNGVLQFGVQKKSFAAKNPSTMDLEVSKLRPRIIHQEREKLYDDAMKQKMAANFLKDENTRLKTKIQILEGEITKKEKLVDDLLMQQDSYQVGGPINQSIGGKGSKVKLEGHLALNLKRKIRELQQLLFQRQEENELLKRNLKSTKITEIEVEMKMYIDECTRLRHQLEEVIKSKDTFADPEELKLIEAKFAQQDALINQLRNENSELANAYSKKEDENRQLREMFTDLEKKSKKAISNGKEANKLKKQLKAQDKEIRKLTGELNHQKAQNADFQTKIEELVKKGPLQQNTSVYNSNVASRPQTNIQGGDDKKVRQELNEKDNKIQELNSVVQQLQTKLQDKINELSKETFDKNKFKGLYEQYQDEVVKLQAQFEDGDYKKSSVKPVVKATAEIPSKQQIGNKPQEESNKDDSYSSNYSQESKQEVKAKNQPNTGLMKARIDKKAITETVQEIKFKLQIKGFYSNQIQDFFFKPYTPDQQVTLKSLQDNFETNGISDKKSLSLARYIIEPKTGAQVSYSEENYLSQKEIIKILSDLLGHYEIYNDGTKIKKYNEVLTKLFAKCKETLKDTLQLEDYEEDGTVLISAFQEAFSTLDLDVEKDIYDYLMYVVYQRSESIERMKYQAVFDLIEGKLVQGQLSVGSNDGSRKRPESSSPEKLKARNKEKFTAGQSEGDQKSKGQVKQQIQDEDEEDNYEEEFEKLLDKDDEDEENNRKNLLKGSDDEEDDDNQPNLDQKEGMDDEEDDEYIDEEVMLDVAEKCFVRIAEAVIKRGQSVRSAFASYIIKEEIETEDGQQQAIELLSPIGFLEGIKELGITDLEEVEVACLMRVLTKADLENAILLRELIVIMENFGIQDDEDDRASQRLDSAGAEQLAENDIENESVKNQADQSMKEDEAGAGKKKKKKKGANTGKALDLSLLDEKSIKIMAKLMLALMELNVSLYEFFEGVIYEQLVKTKTKQNTVEIINTKDFYEFLNQRGVRKSAKEHDNLTKFLQIDPNYPNLLMLKKMAKTLDEMAKNEELMAGILAAVEDDMNGGEGEEQYDNEQFEESNNPQQNNQQRLITIGEDGEEERYFETNKDQSKGSLPTVSQKAKGKMVPAPVQEDDDYEEDEQNEEPYQKSPQDEDEYEEGNDDYEF